MGCNCRKTGANQPRRASASGVKQSFALITNGSKTTFGSKLEADAANARQGYAGVVKPVAP